jgi:L-rhamnose-H+ transport protein
MTVDAASMGALLAFFAGILNGTYTLAMRFLGKWEWENVWLLFTLVCCLILPGAIVLLTVSSPFAIVAQAPSGAILAALVSGGLWGFGAILFGQSVSAIGISLTNTIVLALSAALGSVLSMIVLNASSLTSAHGKLVLLGTAVAIAGMVASGVAGSLREQNRKTLNCVEEEGEGSLVGRRRPVRIGILMCIGAGVLSAIFNIGFSMAQPLIATAVRAGQTATAGANLVWLLMLGSGAIVNIAFCAYLLIKNNSAGKFFLRGGIRLYTLCALMGLFWWGSIFIYGEASSRLGPLGPAIGWPLFLSTGLLVSNVCGILTGEWRSTTAKTRWWVAGGLATLVIAILVLGKAGAM